MRATKAKRRTRPRRPVHGSWHPTGGAAFLTRVVLRNYRSIEACNVPLGPLTVLVGPNGSGKSNFLDALRFTADALRSGLDIALEERGGIHEVRRRSSGHPTHFSIRLDFDLGAEGRGSYAFDIGARKPGGFVVTRERCVVGDRVLEVARGEVTSFPHERPPPAADDRLFLVNASGFPGFRSVFGALSNTVVYNLNPDTMREPQKPDAGSVLRRDGRNIASIVRALPPDAKRRIEEYLAAVVPGIRQVARKRLGPTETLEFLQQEDGESWHFYASNMSDGTLRALGVLTAVFQSAPARVVGIEEPEIALHPGAASVLRECLVFASRRRQVLVTSHSPDLLDDPEWNPDELRAVQMIRGATAIAPLDEPTRSALRDRLYTVGELMRADQLTPDFGAVPKVAQLRLFDEGAP